MGNFRPLFLYFPLFKSSYVQYNILPMSGFELWFSGIGSQLSHNNWLVYCTLREFSTYYVGGCISNFAD